MRPGLALLACLSVAFLHAQDQRPGMLRWMDSEAQKLLAARDAEINAIRTVEEADRRKAAVRTKILDLIGGLPDYSEPLNARITGSIDHGQYRIEKVIFESLPRYYVTGNLYVPNAPGKYPGVLMPMGHWDEGKENVINYARQVGWFPTLSGDPSLSPAVRS